MATDEDILLNFKKKSTDALLSCLDTAPIILVAVKYNVECSVLHSNDPKTHKILPALTPHYGPYYVLRTFSIEKLARDYENQLRSLDLSLFIPKDPKEVKSAR